MSEIFQEAMEAAETPPEQHEVPDTPEQREMDAAMETAAVSEVTEEQREMDEAPAGENPAEAAEQEEMLGAKETGGEKLAAQFFELADQSLHDADVMYENFIHRNPGMEDEALRCEMREDGVRAMLPSEQESLLWSEKDLEKAYAMVDELHDKTVQAKEARAQALIDRIDRDLAGL